MNKEFGKKILNIIAGKKRFQPLFESIYLSSLYCMNIGTGGTTRQTGEDTLVRILKNKLSNIDSPVLFDVGANVGDYCKLLNHYFKGKATIYAFEPSGEAFKQLQQNTKDIAKLNLHKAGLGKTDTTMTLYSNYAGSGLSSLYHRRLEHYDIHMNQTEDVKVYALDTFCQENNISHIHFLKLDVEGHEKQVLEGATRLIEGKKINYIQFEFGGCNIDSRTYFQDFFYLLNPHYKIYRILKDGLYPIGAYKEMYEVFRITNFFAEKRE